MSIKQLFPPELATVDNGTHHTFVAPPVVGQEVLISGNRLTLINVEKIIALPNQGNDSVLHWRGFCKGCGSRLEFKSLTELPIRFFCSEHDDVPEGSIAATLK